MADPAPGVQFTNPQPFAKVSLPSTQSQSISSSPDDGANHATQDVGHRQLEEQTKRPESPASPRALEPPQTDGQNTNPDRSGQRAKSVFFVDPSPEATPALPTEKRHVDVSVREESSETTLKREMHWVSEEVMIGCLVIAVALMLGHHFWYHSRVNQVVGNSLKQQRTRLYVLSDTLWLVL